MRWPLWVTCVGFLCPASHRGYRGRILCSWVHFFSWSVQYTDGQNWFALVLLVCRGRCSAIPGWREEQLHGWPDSGLHLQGHALEANHFHAARLMLRAQNAPMLLVTPLISICLMGLFCSNMLIFWCVFWNEFQASFRSKELVRCRVFLLSGVAW